ncbi:uncharacterized protein [Miscanthus floridulus]|uniref:uncharacterized protein n=1 Tax=Miscanthus floridulus TaxID=154761 RepID=UPI003458B894
MAGVALPAAVLSAVVAGACSRLSQLPGPPCSARLDALSSSPFCAAVRTPPPSVAVFCVVPRSPSSPRPRPPAGMRNIMDIMEGSRKQESPTTLIWMNDISIVVRLREAIGCVVL